MGGLQIESHVPENLDNTPLKEALSEAERHVQLGFFAALFSLITTLIVTVLGASGTFDIGVGADWFMLIDVAIIGVITIGIWMKSRVATTAMFTYFLLSKIILLASGQFNGLIIGAILLYFYGRAMVASYKYHKLRKSGATLADVF